MKKSFTLIELLVVIAIIAILASMLLPALSKARAAAQGIKCTNKLKQLALSAVMYSNDNNGFFPLWEKNAWDDADGALTTWEYKLASYGENRTLWDGAFSCPMTPQADNDDGSPTYLMNGLFSGNGASQTSVKNPTECGLFAERTADANGGGGVPYAHGYWRWAAACLSERFWAYEHNGKNNAAFVDGHVTSRNIGEFDPKNDKGYEDFCAQYD